MCLDGIGKCVLFFICLFGDRYGVYWVVELEVKDFVIEEWLDRNFEMVVVCGYDWVFEEENR